MEPLLNGIQTIAKVASKSSTALRLRAAEALTTSLNHTERTKLYDAIGVISTTTAEKQQRNSVGEAVASALEKEHIKGETRLEHAVTEAELAASERVRAEMTLLKEREETDGAHSLLGKKVVDLGYKRVYISRAVDLAAIPVWEKQRAYGHDRAKEMVEEKIKNKHVGLPGVIALHEDDNGGLSIIDGQHRVGMMALLRKKNLPPDGIGFDLDKVLVEVFPDRPSPHDTSSFAEDVFTDINKAEPIKLVDMPGVATAKERGTITAAVDALRETYPEMFKTSQRCRAPHLNADNLRDLLFSSEILKRHGIGSDKALLKWIDEKNKEIREKYTDCGDAPKGINEKVLKKAEKFDFFLGLESTWLYQ